jgi:phenylacetate-CoA ligase
MILSIEKQTSEEIKSFQEARLKEALRYLQLNSPFYQRHFQKHAIDLSKIKSLDDLVLIPPTTKDDIQKSNWDFLCVPRNKVAEYTSTSGTLGKPVIIALTEKDIQRLAYNEYISLTCADGGPNDIYQLMLTLDRQFMAGIAYYEGIKKIGAGVVRVGPGLPAMQFETILSIKPTTLIAVPSFIIKLIDFANQNGIPLHQTSVKKIVCIGENIRTPDFQLNSLGRKITEQWNVQLYSTYASTEMQTAFTECHHGKGGHHHPELIIIEVLDDNNLPVQSGEAGNLTITSLGIEGMPLLRYKTGDMVQLHEGICACGRTTMRVSQVIGRRQQMIKLKGTSIYPLQIFEVLHQLNISEYVVEAFTGHLGTDELKIYIARDEPAYSKVRDHFQSYLRVLPEIVFISSLELEQMQLGDGSRKPRRFIDRRI